MGVKVQVGDLVYNATQYAVNEDSTPTAVTDSTGSTGTVTFVIKRPDPDLRPDHPILKYTEGWLEGQEFRLDDTRYGFVVGTVSSAQYNADTQDITVTCFARLGLLNVFNVQAQPFSGTLEDAFVYYASLAGVTTDLAVDASIASQPVTVPGFTGDLWYHLKQLAAAQECEIALVAGIIYLRPLRQQEVIKGRNFQRTRAIGGGQLAQSVEVYLYETDDLDNELFYPSGGWSPEVEILNVNAGETAEYVIEFDASISSFDEPSMQTFVAQQTGAYEITAIGAQGGGPSGGKGASMSGKFNLTKGQVLKVLVGQQGNPATTPAGNRGGGGGSFVWNDATNQLLLAAGGGGGSHTNGTGTALGMDAVTTLNGTARRDGNGTPGVGGNGAVGGAAGWLSSGGTPDVGSPANRPLANGYGGTGYSETTHYGGFGGGGGGGGAPSTTQASGGGGGYSGGAGQGTPASVGGGGGGSYNGGFGQENHAGVGEGNGRVSISFLGGAAELTASGSGRTGTIQTFTAPVGSTPSSVYTVVADDGLPVPVALWDNNGGKVEFELNPDTKSMTVTLTGAQNIPLATGGNSTSFSLALASDESGYRYSTLRLVGSGVSYRKTKFAFPTGVSESRTTTEVGVTIDNPFINDYETLYRTGATAAKQFTGNQFDVTGVVSQVTNRGDGPAPTPTYTDVKDSLGAVTYDGAKTFYTVAQGLTSYQDVQDYWAETMSEEFSAQIFGRVQGARVWDRDSRRWFRIRQASIAPDKISFSIAEDDLVYDDMQEVRGTMTYSDVQSLVGGLTYSKERMAGAYA